MSGGECVCPRHETLEYRVGQLETAEKERSNKKSQAVYLVYAQILAAIFMIITAFFTPKIQEGYHDPYREAPRKTEHRPRSSVGYRGDSADSCGLLNGGR